MLVLKYNRGKTILTKQLPYKYSANKSTPLSLKFKNGYELTMYPRIYKSWYETYFKYLKYFLSIRFINIFNEVDTRQLFIIHLPILLLCYCVTMWLTAVKYSRLLKGIYKYHGKN